MSDHVGNKLAREARRRESPLYQVKQKVQRRAKLIASRAAIDSELAALDTELQELSALLNEPLESSEAVAAVAKGREVL
jgi:multidrug resistance efflux pump